MDNTLNAKRERFSKQHPVTSAMTLTNQNRKAMFKRLANAAIALLSMGAIATQAKDLPGSSETSWGVGPSGMEPVIGFAWVVNN